MTTLAVDKQRPMEGGNRNEYPVIAADIIYEGAAVGVVDATGHARPLVAGDRFVGFAVAKADNSAGAAAAINVRVLEAGKVLLPVAGAVITDQASGNPLPVYATDDNAFGFTPVGGSFVGFFHRFTAAGFGVVSFDVSVFRDPWWMYEKREAIAGTKTLDAEDSGKLFGVTDAADADVITVPAVATGLADIAFVAVGAFGTTAVVFDTDGSDGIIGPDLASGDGKTLTLTKATQRRGDHLIIRGAEADSHMVNVRGIWVRET